MVDLIKCCLVLGRSKASGARWDARWVLATSLAKQDFTWKPEAWGIGMLKKEALRRKRHRRLRNRVIGTAEKPRLNVFRSLLHIYAQVIDDSTGNTLVSASSLDKDIKAQAKNGGDIPSAKLVGELVGKRAAEKGIKEVVFDRGGYQYHGRVAALADGAREAGLKF